MIRGRTRFQVLKERQKRVNSSQWYSPEDRHRRKAVGVSLRCPSEPVMAKDKGACSNPRDFLILLESPFEERERVMLASSRTLQRIIGDKSGIVYMLTYKQVNKQYPKSTRKGVSGNLLGSPSERYKFRQRQDVRRERRNIGRPREDSLLPFIRIKSKEDLLTVCSQCVWEGLIQMRKTGKR